MSDLLSQISRDARDTKMALFGMRRENRKPPVRQTLIRAIAVKALGEVHKTSTDEIIRRHYRDDASLRTIVADVGDWHRRAVTPPAMTSVPGWAQELVDTDVYTGMLPALAPTSVYSRLQSFGVAITRGAAAGVRLPSRVAPASVPALFVGEGQPIPVTSFNLTGAMLAPFKGGVLVCYSSEMAKASAVNFETLLRRVLDEQVAIALDAALLSSAAGTPVSPPGLLFGVTPIVASTATDAATAAYEDVRNLIASFKPEASLPVLITGTTQAVSLQMLFPDLAVPVLTTAVMPEGQVVAIDAADFASFSNGDGDIRVDQQSLVQMTTDPTNPDITEGNPVFDMWQSDLRNIRLLEGISFAMRRPGRVAYVEDVGW